jgi:hypothetical protein
MEIAGNGNFESDSMENEVVSEDFRKQVSGYGLTTAHILYRRPDHRWLLQSAAAILRLAELRSVSRISRAAAISGFLDGEARGPAAFGARRALQADQASGAQSGGRRIPAALDG